MVIAVNKGLANGVLLDWRSVLFFCIVDIIIVYCMCQVYVSKGCYYCHGRVDSVVWLDSCDYGATPHSWLVPF